MIVPSAECFSLLLEVVVQIVDAIHARLLVIEHLSCDEPTARPDPHESRAAAASQVMGLERGCEDRYPNAEHPLLSPNTKKFSP